MRRIIPLIALTLLVVACSDGEGAETTTSTTEAAPTTTMAAVVEGAEVLAMTTEDSVEAYEPMEFVVDLDAEYENPFDQREVTLDVLFTGPDGSTWLVPGFWDGREDWKVRFTPAVDGAWTWSASATDASGTGSPLEGAFEVAPSDRPGWLQPGDWIDPSYSPHYLVHQDGTPWYGFGHADLRMSLGTLGADGFKKFDEMALVGENHEMWWPMWAFNFLQRSYDEYDPNQMEIVDLALTDAEASDMYLTFTIWTHQYLRTDAHPWGIGKWQENGFSKLVDTPADFFVDEESWAWQENYYRYAIARWGYSPNIATWQTITEINGTDSYEQTDPWHEAVNAYFQEHDPYRHPTTATKSGSQDWPTAHAVMDVPQMHLYEYVKDPIEAAVQTSYWTNLMWEREAKPNWIGEYGERGQQYYPAMLHVVNWSAFASGSAMTPIEWNDGAYDYGRFDEAMGADMLRHRVFVDTIPLAHWAPEPAQLTTSDEAIRGWAMVSASGGFAWVQDAALEGAPIAEQDADETVRSGVVATISDVPSGTWELQPYDTWTGEWLETTTVECDGDCALPLPDFHRDIAIRFTPAG